MDNSRKYSFPSIHSRFMIMMGKFGPPHRHVIYKFSLIDSNSCSLYRILVSVSSVILHNIFAAVKKKKLSTIFLFSKKELFISHIYCFHTFLLSSSQTLEIKHTACPVLWWHLSKGTTILFPISVAPVLFYLVEFIHRLHLAGQKVFIGCNLGLLVLLPKCEKIGEMTALNHYNTTFTLGRFCRCYF